MTFLEKDLEQIIYDADKELLAQKGLYIKGKLKRQVRIGNYGICDLMTHERPYYSPYYKGIRKGVITVYELKQDKIGISAFLQALGYLQGIRHFLRKRKLNYNYNYKIVLIGKELDLVSTYCFLTSFINDYDLDNHIDSDCKFLVENYTYNYGIDGIRFEEKSDFSLADSGF